MQRNKAVIKLHAKIFERSIGYSPVSPYFKTCAMNTILVFLFKIIKFIKSRL